MAEQVAQNINLSVGDTVECTVEQIMPYGAFVRITSTGRKGMIHISELSYSFVKDINEVLKLQDKVMAKIIKIDEKGRIDLSIKQTQEPPQREARPPRRTPSVRHEVRDFREMQSEYREQNPAVSESFEQKMSAFLKTSEAKITDLNTRAAKNGRTSPRRRNNNRDY